MERYKQGHFYSQEFVGENSWNGFEYNCLFANRGGGRFIDVGRATGSDVLLDSRAVAVADVDGDGRLDLVISNNGAAPSLLLNRLPEAGNWVELDLAGTRGNRDAVGAKVRLVAGGRTLTRVVEAGSGYATQSPHTLHFGLGAAERVEELLVEWPSGLQERHTGRDAELLAPVNARSRFEEPGDSTAVRRPPGPEEREG